MRMLRYERDNESERTRRMGAHLGPTSRRGVLSAAWSMANGPKGTRKLGRLSSGSSFESCEGASNTRLPPRRERAEGQTLRKLLLPHQPAHGLGVVDPFPPALLGLLPVPVESGDVELIEVVCRRGRRYCCHVARDLPAHAGCSVRQGSSAVVGGGIAIAVEDQ